jgi:hypothetical protein
MILEDVEGAVGYASDAGPVLSARERVCGSWKGLGNDPWGSLADPPVRDMYAAHKKRRVYFNDLTSLRKQTRNRALKLSPQTTKQPLCWAPPAADFKLAFQGNPPLLPAQVEKVPVPESA